MSAEPAVKTERMPRWMLRPIRCGSEMRRVEKLLSEGRLHTVCEGARCPNRGECFSGGTAAFMILGDVCTRDCSFCAVDHGVPEPPREEEPEALALAAAGMGLRHVVVTSVTRDDLSDGGASYFARAVEETRRALPGASVEVLTPDFAGDERAIDAVVAAGPDVFNHNLETVERLYGTVRPQADYERSLAVLARAAGAGIPAKSGLMVGLGEQPGEVEALFGDLRRAGVGMVTVGQYLRPTEANLPVERFWEPGEFEALESLARVMGFEAVASGPLVRSSYRAAEMLGRGASGEARTGDGVKP